MAAWGWGQRRMISDVHEHWVSSSGSGNVSVLNSEDGYTALEVCGF